MGELAAKLGLPREEFVNSAEEYGRSATGSPDRFGRVAADMEPLETGPFYGVALWPCLLNTQGGPRRDRHARVLDGLGEAIPGLFSAGELGSIWGPLYPGSGNVAEAVVFGEIAGRNAAAGVG
jgi:succinate dehydrogenase/fumarate reductase flavoprotein subunit